MSQTAESLMEERVVQLQEISKRRNELLREMFYLIQKRDNLGSVISTEEEDDDESLQLFLERFDVEKHPDTGLISTLLEDEIAIPDTPPEYSPVVPLRELAHEPSPSPQPLPEPEPEPMVEVEPEPEPQPSPEPEVKDQPPPPPEPVPEGTLEEEEGVVSAITDSPMSEPPVSPRGEEQEAKEPALQYPDPSHDEVAMEIDVAPPTPLPPSPKPPSEQVHAEMDEDMASREGTQEPPPAPEPSELSEHVAVLTEDIAAEKSPTPTRQQRAPSQAPVTPAPRDTPAPLLASPPLATSRRTSSPRASLPRSQPPPSPPPRQSVEVTDDSAVKAEPLDDAVMEVVDAQPKQEVQDATQPSTPAPEMTAWQPPITVSPAQLLNIQSEDQIMAILGPSQARLSPPSVAEEQRATVEYSIPLPAIEHDPSFAFADGANGAMEFETLPDRYPSFGPDPPYPLPPMSLLPIEFSRRKASKRKRDKGETKKEEWQPMGLNKWAAVLKANPVHTKMLKASKCLSTKDWSVGISEMRLLRVFERVEKMKDLGAWSFRQPKKQRGVGSSTKTHWDYLMDEMKWMRTDFREERRWKLALAYNLAHAALEWHEAGSLAERVRLGIVVRWSPPPPEDAEMAEAEEGEQVDGPFRDSQETDENGVDSRETGTPLDGYASDEESDDEPDKETVDTLAPSVALQDALEQLEQAQTGDGRPDVAEGVTLKPKVEEIEDLTALGDSAGSKDENAMDIDQTKNSATKSGNSSASTAQASDIHPGLKSTSKNPVLGVPSKEGEGSHSKGKNKVNQYAALREHIVYSEFDKLFIDWDDLDLAKGMSELSTEEPVLPSSAAPPQPHDLSSVFPDLPTYGMFDLAPLPSTEGKKKSDKKSDKDDPNRRMDEATYNKLTLTSRFMAAKPTLVGTLHPANHFKDGEWSRIEETPIFLDIDVVHPKEENLCSLFEGATPKPNVASQPIAPRDIRKRNTDPEGIAWTPIEDSLLKQAVERYPTNWQIVADAFNSSRVTISTDKRTAWECAERWKEIGKENKAVAGSSRNGDMPEESASASSAPSYMATRGHKRTLNQISTGPSNGSGSAAAAGEPRKRRRHAAMYDTLRKSAKKREMMQKNSALPRPKTTAVHDTHGQFTKLPRLTPAELSRMKAEKEAAELRRRNEEFSRQQMLREQQQRAQGLPVNAQQPQTPQAQMHPQPNVARPASAQVPVVQAIRSQVGISQQQQRMAAAALASANANPGARMSPPQLAAAVSQQQQQQLQVAQMRAMAAVQGQAQVQQQASGQVVPHVQVQSQHAAQIAQSNASAALTAAAPALSAVHLSPPFAARASSSSPGVPHQSPPLPAASPANVPRPPSVPGHGVPVNLMAHGQANMQYYLQSLRMQNGGNVTPEQMALLVRHQQQQQQHYAAHAQQQQQGQNQPNGNFPHS